MPVLTIPKTFREKVGDVAADDFAEFIGETVKEERDNTLLLVEEKFERRLSEEAAKLDKRITEETSRLRADLEVKIESIKSDIIKWMFIFWVGQFAALVAVLQIFFRN